MKNKLAYAPKPRTPEKYGKQKRVVLIENRDTDTASVNSSFDMPKKLPSPDADLDGYLLLDYEGKSGAVTDLHAGMCFCNECQKPFETDIDIKGTDRIIVPDKARRSDTINGAAIKKPWSTVTVSDPYLSADPVCPECGKEFRKVAFLTRETESGIDQPGSFEKEGSSPVYHQGKWVIPPRFVRRQLIESRTDDGKLTALDDLMLFKRTVIDKDGNATSYGTEIGDNIDLITQDRIHTESIIQRGKRTTYYATSDTDPYSAYTRRRRPSFEMHHILNAPTSINQTDRMDSDYLGLEFSKVQSYDINPGENTLSEQYMYSGMIQYGLSVSEGTSRSAYDKGYFADVKSKMIEENFRKGSAQKNPIMADSAKNGMYLMEHTRDSDESNTLIDDNFRNKVTMMMIKYPVAFDYAVERAENHVINYEFSQKRRAKEAEEQGLHYEPKTMTEKGKARFMREELGYVADQLACMDKNLRQIVRDSPNTSALRANMASVAFGDQYATIKSMKGHTKELIDGKHFSIDTSQAQNDPVKSTKILVNKFNLDVFGVTNTIYTAQKMGIRNIDHINALVDIGLATSPAQQKPSKYPKVKNNAHAGMIKPIESQTEIAFMRSFVKTHNPSDVIDLYRDPKKFDCYDECLKMYDNVRNKNATIASIDNPKTERYIYETDKSNIQSYLTRHSVEDAYIAYVSRFGRNSPEYINGMIADIKVDKKMPEIKDYAAEHGMDAAIEHYQSDFEGTSSFVKKDIPGYIEHAGEPSEFEGQQILVTRNGKSLFRGRSITDIHDELSTINKHLVDSNEPLIDYYPDELKEMERSYPNPDGEGEWSFHCHKDSYDIIKSSTHLHNCMGSSHVQDIKYGSRFTLYMEDENGQRVAGIELKQKYGSSEQKWEVLQFQGDHDTAISSKYAGVAKQWLQDCNIDYSHCSNVQAFGQTTENGRPLSFYGENADYHQMEIDEATGQAVNRYEIVKRAEERLAMAKSLFHYDETTGKYDFGVDIPEAP